MVRTLRLHTENRPELSRILAIAAAIAVHAFAFLLLLIPLTAPPLRVIVERDRPDVRIIEVEKKKEIEPVTVPVERKPASTRPVATQTRQASKPQDTPVVVDGGTVPTSTSTVVDAGQAAETGPVVTGPISVSSLGYADATPPPYPRDAARTGAQGTVLLKVLVDTDGTPLEVAIHESSGNRSLDRGAREHVLKHWRFQPAMHDGHAVQAYGLVPIVFSMQ
ncbi:MAG TPA: TonB family protein [Pseudoxanthomonas sp.]